MTARPDPAGQFKRRAPAGAERPDAPAGAGAEADWVERTRASIAAQRAARNLPALRKDRR